MTTKSIFVRHLFAGGWSTDFGPTIDIAPDAAGFMRLPFLIDADNCIFELDGGPHKAPGTTRLNSSALESGAVVKGLFDFWIQGTGGSPAQHRIIHVGTTIKRDDADGTFTDLFTGLESGAVPSYCSFDDIVIMASDSTSDVPRSWDGTTAQSLAGTPPNFSFCVKHKNRLFAAGDAANPSTLSFCVSVDPEDWIGSGSGTIQIDPQDGDQITGLASHKDELWIFKGPYKGSIHRLTGSAPTGSDAFAVKPFIEGLGAVGHNTIFRFGDDLGFMWSDGTIHSLTATAAFGDFNEAALSRPIHNYFRDHFNHSRLKHAWAAEWSGFGFVLFTVPIDTSTNNNLVLMMDYRFLAAGEPFPRWAPWPAFEVAALSQVIDSAASDIRLLMAGSNDGFVLKLGQRDRSINGSTAIEYKVTTPFMNYATPVVMKTLTGGSLGIQPKNNGNLTFGWQRDDNAQQTATVAQGGTDVLGTASANQFTLGTSTLGGANFVDRWFPREEGGEFRSIQFQVTNNVNSEDVELHSLSAIVEGDAWSLEN